MEISEALIQRFFKGECNAQEAEAVLSYLESQPGAMEKYLGQKEWDQVAASADPDSAQSARMLENIQHALSEKPIRRLPGHYIGIAAALAIIVGALFFLPKTNMQVTPHRPAYASGWKMIRNEAGNVRHYKLEDGSAVELDPGSAISFPEHFHANRRDIKLIGRALFQVAKDSKRPFTVMAENTSTTALGTKFLINARHDRPATEISLLEGKVMIRVANKQHGTFEEYYLTPNQQLVYAKQSGSVLIKPIKDREASPSNSKRASDLLSIDRPVAAISFYRAPIDDVFRTLGQRYQVEINYPGAGLQNHYFTGSFYAADTLERILQVVAEVNDLEVRKTRSGYQIIKIKNKFHQ